MDELNERDRNVRLMEGIEEKQGRETEGGNGNTMTPTNYKSQKEGGLIFTHTKKKITKLFR